MMKKPLVLGLLVFGVFQSHAALSFYDGFNYNPGELLAPISDTTGNPIPGQHNVDYNFDWRYAGAGGVNNNPPGVGSGGLSYSGLQPSLGNSVLFDTTQIGSTRIQIAASAISSGTVYWSGLLRVNSISTLTTGVNGMLLGGFNNTAGPGGLPTAVGAVLRIRQDSIDPAAYHIGTGMNSGTGVGNVQFDNATSYLAGETVFVVAAYEFVAGANNDIARMWINPAVIDFGAASPPAATLTSAPGGAVLDSFASLLTFNLRNVNTVGAPALQFDELRIGTDWADVTPVPEPSAMALGGLAMLMAILRYGFRRRLDA